MAKMDASTLSHLCELSKLNFSDEEKDKVMTEMGDIIELMDTIQNFDIVYDDTKDKNEITFDEVRKDEAGASFPTEKLLSNTEAVEKCYSLPKMME